MYQDLKPVYVSVKSPEAMSCMLGSPPILIYNEYQGLFTWG
jgi:hypothetical protein